MKTINILFAFDNKNYETFLKYILESSFKEYEVTYDFKKKIEKWLRGNFQCFKV